VEKRVPAVFSANITHCFFKKHLGAPLDVEGSSSELAATSIFEPNFAIGGLDTEFKVIVPMAFCRRGIKHVKLSILFRAPEKAKMLMAWQIGKMQDIVDPKIVNRERAVSHRQMRRWVDSEGRRAVEGPTREEERRSRRAAFGDF
jgi:hypothetical protein